MKSRLPTPVPTIPATVSTPQERRETDRLRSDVRDCVSATALRNPAAAGIRSAPTEIAPKQPIKDDTATDAEPTTVEV